MRPFDSTGMDRAMSDQRVQRLTFEAAETRYGYSRKPRYRTICIWDRKGMVSPDYDHLPPTGRIMLDVHFADGRVMSMREYLATEAANAVRKPKKDRRRRHEGEEA